MAQPDSDPNLVQWLLGLFATIIVGWVARLWIKIDGISREIAKGNTDVAAAATAADREIWAAITKDRDSNETYRTRMLERLAEIPTKSDLAAMETRMSQRFEGSKR